MSSPFSSSNARVIPAWSKNTADQTTFVPFNPFGTFTIDLGYGSGAYGDLPYGQNVLSKVTFTTDWTKRTEISSSFTSVNARVVPVWVQS